MKYFKTTITFVYIRLDLYLQTCVENNYQEY